MNNLSIQNIKGLSAEALLEIERAYPYFLLPKMFRLKKYFSDKHPDYQPLLHKTAIFSFKREALYDFLHNTEQEMIPTPLTVELNELKNTRAPLTFDKEIEESAEAAKDETPTVEFSQPEIQVTEPAEEPLPEMNIPESVIETPAAEEISTATESIETVAPIEIDEEAQLFAAKVDEPMIELPQEPIEHEAIDIDVIESPIDSSSGIPISEFDIQEISEVATNETTSVEEESLPIEEAPEAETSDATEEELETPKAEEEALISENAESPVFDIPAGNIKDIEATIYNNLKDILEKKSEPVAEISQPAQTEEAATNNKAAEILQEASENSFLQWLKIVEKKKTAEQKGVASPNQAESKLKMVLGEKTEKINVKKDPELDALDGFVKDQIKRKKKKNPHVIEIPFEQTIQMSTEQMDIISEGLAKLLFKQGKFERATAMYEKLILKYPEKSALFAAQIDLIKDLNN